MPKIWAAAVAAETKITVPSPVIVEWWRGQRGPISRVLDAVDVELPDVALCKSAGEALARTGEGNAIDALVMASAARRGDLVYTSDFDDFQRLGTHFPTVRVFRI
jgi:predicted nucleic acid-binding protein